ncbi:MAG: N-acetylmuramic acid 6-phosphate etherase [Oscillospiraceae bacterium]|nr:N-acetylmuramic acid 6-phosphate etherase [Oscillospiraceae bacterium]MBQ7119655.1 N-acetylmuramic acid 6-phosphate etherase [Oscillospiraceae bacterium]
MNKTEMRNPATMNIHKESTIGILSLIQAENENAVKAINDALPKIAEAADCIEEGMRKGGRLIYIGAGTSGRLGIIDATECPPTYGVSPDTVVGLIAGGRERVFSSSENAEDIASSGISDLKALNLTSNDRIVGISAAGNAAYVADALAYARTVGCKTIGFSSNFGSRLDVESDISIVTDTGPEVIMGSTRMKAGAAQKMVTTMLSTCVMIKLGHVYENMMVNLKPSNEKLRKRVINIVRDIVKCDEERAINLLEENNWTIKEVIKTLGL